MRFGFGSHRRSLIQYSFAIMSVIVTQNNRELNADLFGFPFFEVRRELTGEHRLLQIGILIPFRDNGKLIYSREWFHVNELNIDYKNLPIALELACRLFKTFSFYLKERQDGEGVMATDFAVAFNSSTLDSGHLNAIGELVINLWCGSLGQDTFAELIVAKIRAIHKSLKGKEGKKDIKEKMSTTLKAINKNPQHKEVLEEIGVGYDALKGTRLVCSSLVADNYKEAFSELTPLVSFRGGELASDFEKFRDNTQTIVSSLRNKLRKESPDNTNRIETNDIINETISLIKNNVL